MKEMKIRSKKTFRSLICRTYISLTEKNNYPCSIFSMNLKNERKLEKFFISIILLKIRKE